MFAETFFVVGPLGRPLKKDTPYFFDYNNQENRYRRELIDYNNQEILEAVSG
jgi:hypothetical protein